MKSPMHILFFFFLALLSLMHPVFAKACKDKCPIKGVEHCNRSNGDLLICENNCWKKKWSCPKGQQCVMNPGPGPQCISNGDVCKICHDQYNNCRKSDCNRAYYAKCHNDVCNAYDGRCKSCNLQC